MPLPDIKQLLTLLLIVSLKLCYYFSITGGAVERFSLNKAGDNDGLHNLL